MVDTPTINPPHRYLLRSRTRANHTVESIGEGAVAFQGVIEPTMGKMQGYTKFIHGPIKISGIQHSSTSLVYWGKVQAITSRGQKHFFSFTGQRYQRARGPHIGGLMCPSGPTKTKPTASASPLATTGYHMRGLPPQNVQVSSQPIYYSTVLSQPYLLLLCTRTYTIYIITPPWKMLST